MATINETTGTTTTYDTPLWQMTQGEFTAMLNRAIESKVSALFKQALDAKEKKDDVVYGLKGICKIFNCGINKANEIKQSGVIDDAIVQTGRTIVIYKERALECVKKHQDKINKKRR